MTSIARTAAITALCAAAQLQAQTASSATSSGPAGIRVLFGLGLASTTFVVAYAFVGLPLGRLNPGGRVGGGTDPNVAHGRSRP